MPEIVTSTELYNLGTLSAPVIVLTVNAVVADNPAGNAGLTLINKPVTVPVVEYDVAVALPPYAFTGIKLTAWFLVADFVGTNVEAITGGPPLILALIPPTAGADVYFVHAFFLVIALYVN